MHYDSAQTIGIQKVLLELEHVFIQASDASNEVSIPIIPNPADLSVGRRGPWQKSVDSDQTVPDPDTGDAHTSPIGRTKFKLYNQATLDGQLSPLAIHHAGSEVYPVMNTDQTKAVYILTHQPDNAAVDIEIWNG